MTGLGRWAGLLVLAGCAAPEPLVPGPTVAGMPESGAYAGAGKVTYSAGGACRDFGTRQFYVDGDRFLFGSFGGPIAPDWTVLSTAGVAYLEGRFSGRHFDGALVQGPSRCSYALSLDWVPGSGAPPAP